MFKNQTWEAQIIKSKQTEEDIGGEVSHLNNHHRMQKFLVCGSN